MTTIRRRHVPCNTCLPTSKFKVHQHFRFKNWFPNDANFRHMTFGLDTSYYSTNNPWTKFLPINSQGQWLKNKSMSYGSCALHFPSLCRVLRKLGIMLVRKVSSQISRLIRDDTLRLNWIFANKRLHLKEKCHKSGKCCPWLACADCTG